MRFLNNCILQNICCNRKSHIFNNVEILIYSKEKYTVEGGGSSKEQGGLGET